MCRRESVVAVDRDPLAISIAEGFRDSTGGRVEPVRGRFGELADRLAASGIKPGSFDGVLFDVGVSSMQLDDTGDGWVGGW